MSIYGSNWGLIGHETAVTLLARRLHAGTVSHAYLFAGLPNIGKTTLAMRLAQALNCENPGTAPCGQCRACDLIARSGHSDVMIVEPEGRSTKIEAVREMQGFLNMRPYEAAYRVAVMLEADKATPSAQDALLKTLEEPPPRSKLFLTARDGGGLLATIRSRCQSIVLRPVPARTIEAALSHRVAGISSHDATLIAQLAMGRPGWALTAAAAPDLLSARAEQIDGLIAILNGDRVARFAYAETAAALDRVERADVLALWQTWWRDVLLVLAGGHTAPVNVDHLDDLHHIAGQVGYEGAWKTLNAITRTAQLLANTNTNPRLALEVMMLDVPYLG